MEREIVLALIVGLIVLIIALGIMAFSRAFFTKEENKLAKSFRQGDLSLDGANIQSMNCYVDSGKYNYRATVSIEIKDYKGDQEFSYTTVGVVNGILSVGRYGTSNAIKFPEENPVSVEFNFNDVPRPENGFQSNKQQQLYLTFWLSSKCVDNYMKNIGKSILLVDKGITGMIDACPSQYIYGKDIYIIPDNNACICENKNQMECLGLCYWDGSRCNECKTFDNCGELDEEQCIKCAGGSCIWTGTRCAQHIWLIQNIYAEDIGSDLCEVHSEIENSESSDWTEKDRVKAIINCGKELYIPPVAGAYITLPSGESIIVPTISRTNYCPKTPQGEEWKISLYKNCDENKASKDKPCGPDATLLAEENFRC